MHGPNHQESDKRLISIPTTSIRMMASPSVDHGRLSFATWENINWLLTRIHRPLVSPTKGFPPLHTQPPPCNLPQGSLLVCIRFPYPLPLTGSLPSALALHVLYKPSTSLPCHFSFLKMETPCFSKMLPLTCKYTWRQNPRLLQHDNDHCENFNFLSAHLCVPP
jgi:hypothetical protein